VRRKLGCSEREGGSLEALGTNEPDESDRSKRKNQPRKDEREERVRAIRKLIQANRYDFENKLPLALVRLLNDVYD
jgi:hypothetical protein